MAFVLFRQNLSGVNGLLLLMILRPTRHCGLIWRLGLLPIHSALIYFVRHDVALYIPSRMSSTWTAIFQVMQCAMMNLYVPTGNATNYNAPVDGGSKVAGFIEMSVGVI